MTFGSPVGSPPPEGLLYLAASGKELQASLRAVEEQQRRTTPDFEFEYGVVNQPDKWQAVACWPIFRSTQELERLRRSNESATYHMLQTLHYCHHGHTKLTGVSLRDREDVSICREVGTAARNMLVNAGMLKLHRQSRTSWTTTLEYCRVLYSILKEEPAELEQIDITGKDANIWKRASSLVYRLLQAANISEQELLDSCKEIAWPSFWADEVRHLEPLAEVAERVHKLGLATSLSSQSLEPPLAPRRNRKAAGRVKTRQKGLEVRIEKKHRFRALNGLDCENILKDAYIIHGHALRNTAQRKNSCIY
ncbi:hypothetical protein F5Y06DRAFT_298818 [Hypoxylon sp. FL0890]|nr:hypothetical protein F5Y06DRAFT_298818 [Hypoxylon sp. FL0890]